VNTAMAELLDVLARLAPTDVTLTLFGETGSGKDELARAIHENGPRGVRPFVVFECAAVPVELAEGELFGRGEGPRAETEGAFERADGGTLLLEEVGELPLDVQLRLVNVLEKRVVRRLGESQDRPFDVRVVVATERDLSAEVSAGRLRRDLYFRLAPAIVPVPPLRDRLEDLPLLVEAFLADRGHSGLRVDDATYQVLRAHPWLGNVRELENTLLCALPFVDERGVLEPEHFRLEVSGGDHGLERLPLAGQRLDHIERAAIKLTLARAGGNKVQAARSLGIAVSTLYEKLKKYGLG